MIKRIALQIKKKLATSLLVFTLILSFQNYTQASNTLIKNDTISFNEYKGKVIDGKTKKILVFASLTVDGTNISTVTNTQGKFILKIPKKNTTQNVTISFLGYTSKVLNLSNFSDKTIIKLETYIEELNEVKISIKDAKSLILEVLKRKGDNYFNELTTMTAFYRETIKKRRTYVSLSEAVVEINKQPYTNTKKDFLKLHKARKNTDYTRLDTVAFKLRGGPFNSLYIDIIKNPTFFFEEDMVEIYDFSFDTPTKVDNRIIYVVNFKQKPHVKTPLFYGKLYIDAQTLALTNAKFQLNVEDKEKASKVFIVRKPKDANVYPTEALYQIDYRVKNGKWYYGYSRIQLSFKINWNRKLFNTIYHTTIEMAITDWKKNETNKLFKVKDRLRPSVIISEKASGFSDPEFWGAYNVIEPEKPIESAIKKIKKQLKKLEQ
ncbi:MAG: carboxypeptidase-like regulatory domain-containing protein [Lutibacter sp.]|uniref:carboxypeptidase-like regulatory domain-containing protein n=1 Tax=Lutibacter sp. TaxID=1925666 RepID=UPI0019EDF49C|nr:carboxypeptidase-like regulatory domain-containing protein [Lutibacter sp.]NOR28085.1 carboxypeptidase-like regulatory domain-containing protein [Lutibacter sp.]